jgi:hypothetical protein
MANRPEYQSPESAETQELLFRVGMIGDSREPRRSNPLSDPPAFRELAARLAGMVDVEYDLIVVRNLFGDKVLGYQLSLISGKPTAVSFDREGVIVLDPAVELTGGSRTLLVADIHFTPHNIRAASSGIEKAGLNIAGLGLLMQAREDNYLFPVWSLSFR